MGLCAQACPAGGHRRCAQAVRPYVDGEPGSPRSPGRPLQPALHIGVSPHHLRGGRLRGQDTARGKRERPLPTARGSLLAGEVHVSTCLNHDTLFFYRQWNM